MKRQHFITLHANSKTMKQLSIAILFAFHIFILMAQEGEKVSNKNIFEALSTVDSASHASVMVRQDERITLALVDRKPATEAHQASTITGSGYRVQVFSSNMQRTAKAEAYKIEKKLKDQFPDQAVYVNYTSPFWKVRIGDFKTIQEAKDFRNQLIDAFPELKSETYTVKDTINL